MDIKASEISSILKEQIKGFDQKSEVSKSVKCSSVTALPVFMALIMYKPAKWLSSAAFAAWP